MSNSTISGITIEQYLSYQSPSGMNDELIEGEVVLSPSPMPEHADICARAYDLLSAILRKSDFVVRLDTSIRLQGSESMPRPDVLVMDRSRWNTAATTKTYPVGSPQLVIEVFSPANQSEAFTKKPQLYLLAGAAAVWVVRPDLQMTMVHTSSGTEERVLGQKLWLPAPLLEGSILVDQLFFDD